MRIRKKLEPLTTEDKGARRKCSRPQKCFGVVSKFLLISPRLRGELFDLDQCHPCSSVVNFASPICYSFRTMREIRGAVAVVTGAGSGIGRALAQELAGRGAQLALADLNMAGLEETRGLLGGAEARTYKVDVSRAAEVEQFARQVQQDFGRVSLLVNNAGVALFGT